jgi:translocator protein
MMLKEIWISLLVCIAIPLVTGSLAGLANVNSINNWYATLAKPSFNPPNYLFGPVWTVLYILMGISLYFIFQSPKSELRNTALFIFAIQLLLNLSWSFIFFYFQSPFYALIIIIAMWIGILLMIISFFRISHPAAYLQIPYLLWVSFATVLNGAIWYLNR